VKRNRDSPWVGTSNRTDPLFFERTKNLSLKLKFAKISVVRSRILGFNAAKEKLEIVIRAAPPLFRIFAGGLPRRLRRRKRFGLIQE